MNGRASGFDHSNPGSVIYGASGIELSAHGDEHQFRK
jgi:hypothetical protein